MSDRIYMARRRRVFGLDGYVYAPAVGPLSLNPHDQPSHRNLITLNQAESVVAYDGDWEIIPPTEVFLLLTGVSSDEQIL